MREKILTMKMRMWNWVLKRVDKSMDKEAAKVLKQK